VLAGAAAAQGRDWRAATVGERSGLTIGASIGRGSIAIDCNVCQNVSPLTEALSTSLHVGFMLNPRLAILTEYWQVQYSDRGSDWFSDSQDHYVAQHMQTVGTQLWLTRALYLRAGIGVGWHHSDSYYAQPHRDGPMAAAGQGTSQPESSKYSPAVTAGIGYEFAHTRSFAADVQIRVGNTHRPADEYQVQNVALTFGAAWY